jgi:hypothetical protein
MLFVGAARSNEVMISRFLGLLGFRNGKSSRLGLGVRYEVRREDWRRASLREVKVLRRKFWRCRVERGG